MKELDVFGVASQVILSSCASHGEHASHGTSCSFCLLPTLHGNVQILMVVVAVMTNIVQSKAAVHCVVVSNMQGTHGGHVCSQCK